ncbi:MAG TPA: T9SS type A sorting domain-containing protein [Bacteroidales bacterium]|nr:T9SS type A sorting domain-containing protein [Bacteroidales bacterium]HRZ76807.1 T9SS type A sorting domain-containing protein [Bacteroidales bacterium]
MSLKISAPGKILTPYIYAIENDRENVVIIFPFIDSGIHTHIAIYEISHDGILINHKDLGNPGTGLISVYDIVQINENEYRFISNNHLTKSYSYINVIDSNFNLKSSYGVLWGLSDLNSLKLLSDSTLLITGRKALPSLQDYQIALIRTDLRNVLLDSLELGQVGIMEYPGHHSSLGNTGSSTIYFGATSGANITNLFFSNHANSILVNKFDSSLNLLWSKYYGKDAYYYLMDVEEASDGGSYCFASKFDTNSTIPERDVVLLKFDQNGIISSQIDLADEITSFKVYPNPAHRDINIEFQTPFTGRIELFSSNSCLVKSWEVTARSKLLKLSIPVLTRGVYLIVARSNTYESSSKVLMIQ